MNMSSFEIKFLVSNMLFYQRTYFNGEQIFLNKECIENLSRILDEIKPKDFNEIFEFYSLENIKKILGNLIPKDAELINRNLPSFDDFGFPIINFYSQSSYKKINKKPSSFKYSDFKFFGENKKYKAFEYPSPKKLEKDFYSILIIGRENCNRYFLNGFLNYLFDINEEDNFRLVLDTYKDKKENPFETFYISSKKGDFAFYSLNSDNLEKLKSDEEELINFFKSIEKNSINLILINMYLVDNEPYIELNESEKSDIFFACPSLSFYVIQFHIFDKLFTISETLKKRELDEKLMKAIILHIAKRDELIRLKFNSSNFNYDSIFSGEKNMDIFFKYKITMEGFKNFYDIITKRKTVFIDFSPIVKYLSSITEPSKDIKQKTNLFDTQKGENWTEYHLYEIKIKSLEKENEKMKIEKNDLEKQKLDYYINFKKQNDNLDTLINEKYSIMNSNLESIKLLEEKRNKIYKDNQEKINQEIRKFNNELNPNNIDNLKECHKLIIEDLNTLFRIPEYGKSYSGGGCC